MTLGLKPLCGKAIAATFALAAPAAAGATSPASLWAGVERIAVRCSTSDNAVSAGDRARLCAAVAAEIGKRSAYPVVSADAGYTPDILGDLVVTVDARAAAGAIALTLQPSRMANGLGAARAQQPARATIAAGAKGAELGRAIASAVNQILPKPQERRGRVPSPKRAS
jgi:hypothetical protein